MSRQVVTPTVTTDISCFHVALYAPTALVEPIRDVRCKFLHAVSICRYLGKHTINAIVAHVARVTQRRLSTHTPPMGHARIQVLDVPFLVGNRRTQGANVVVLFDDLRLNLGDRCLLSSSCAPLS